MRLLYISNVKMPTNKAHGVHMIKMCEAFANAGLDVIFVVPMRFSSIKNDPYEYYNVERNFKIKKILSIDAIHLIPLIGYPIQLVSFSIFTAIRYLFVSRKNIRIHTREYVIAVFFKILGFKTTYEAHSIVSHKLYFLLLSIVDAIVTNSNGVALEFKKRGFPKVLAAPNAVNLSDFNISDSKEQLRKELSIPQGQKVVMYSGHLYAWKGIDTIVNTAKILSSENIQIICVGGTDEDVVRYRGITSKLGLKNIEFIGHVKNVLVPKYLKTADVLLLPNSPISVESIKYTSPMKLFEYMASGVPIVVSDLPSMREILSDTNAVFFKPDNEQGCAQGIRRLLKDKSFADSISSQALKEVQKYSWKNRARIIIEFAHYNI